MKTTPMLYVEFDGPVAVLTLASPPANAVNAQWLDEFGAALDKLGTQPGISVLHIRSSQRLFCAGADLRLMTASIESSQGADDMLIVVSRMQQAFARLESLPCVTLAEIGGAALGGGFELALACDLRIAAADVSMGLPEARLGLLPGAGGTQRLSQLCGAGTAKRLILGAEVVQGTRALELGLVQWLVPGAALKEKAEELAAALGALPHAALEANKRCIDASQQRSSVGFDMELLETRKLFANDETRHLVHQFTRNRGRPT